MNDELKNAIFYEIEGDITNTICYYFSKYNELPKEELIAAFTEGCEKVIRMCADE